MKKCKIKDLNLNLKIKSHKKLKNFEFYKHFAKKNRLFFR